MPRRNRDYRQTGTHVTRRLTGSVTENLGSAKSPLIGLFKFEGPLCLGALVPCALHRENINSVGFRLFVCCFCYLWSNAVRKVQTPKLPLRTFSPR